METYKNLKTGTRIGLILSIIFILIGFGVSIYNIVAPLSIPDPTGVELPLEQGKVPESAPTGEEVSMEQGKAPESVPTGTEVSTEQGKVPESAPTGAEVAAGQENGPKPPSQSGIPGYVKDIICLVIYSLTAFYALFGYKKTHGNLLKYLFIIFALSLILNVCFGNVAANTIGMISAACTCLAALILVYVSGRLNRIEQNRFLLLIAGILLLATTILPIIMDGFNINGFFNACSSQIMILTLGFAYTARFEEHKAAGLEDK